MSLGNEGYIPCLHFRNEALRWAGMSFYAGALPETR